MAQDPDTKAASTEAKAAANDEQLSSNGGQGVHASDRNSAQAAAAVDAISPPVGTTKPDASARSEHNAVDQLKSADENYDDKNEPNDKPDKVQEPFFPKDAEKEAKPPTEPEAPKQEGNESRPNAPALNPEDSKNEAGIRAGSEEDQESATNLQPNQDPEDDTASKVLDDAEKEGDKDNG